MKLLDLEQYLAQHTYPGRGIALGRTPDNNKVAVAYFIMGRSENSRNRIFEDELIRRGDLENHWETEPLQCFWKF